MSTKQVSGTLITRSYGKFRGVDFSNRKDEVSVYRSPDALNVWKNYKSSSGRCIETRPDIELLKEYSNTIHGLFFYTYKGEAHRIVHVGTNLYDEDKVIYSNMAENKSNYFVYNNNLFIMDGKSYLAYNGTEIEEVVGYVPTTTVSRSPLGSGEIYEDVNLLSPFRKNSFCADGEAKEYKLDVESFDENSQVRVWIDDKEITEGFTPNYKEGKITFTTAPKEPLTTGQDNVVIQFQRTVEGYRDRIQKCTLAKVFDNRVFFSGNPDYPNVLFHSSLENPAYCSDLDYYEEGTTDSKVKSIVAGNNALWVLKEPSQSNTTIFYHNPTIDSEYGKIYPSTHSSISTGCKTTGINFKDAICFFSDKGMEGISGDVTTEQVIVHKSSFVDSKLLNEAKYKDMILEEWQGYLLVIVGNHVYLADGEMQTAVNNHYEYEWFYWEFDKEITGTFVKDEVLYLCMNDKIYILTNKEPNINAYWTTLDDEFNYPQYQKITNKKGCTIDIEGKSIKVYAKADNQPFDLIKTFDSIKGYIVPRIKKKKWKSIQIKISSNKPFKLYSLTLESYVGSYVKR